MPETHRFEHHPNAGRLPPPRSTTGRAPPRFAAAHPVSVPHGVAASGYVATSHTAPSPLFLLLFLLLETTAQPSPDVVLPGLHGPTACCIDPTTGELYVAEPSWNRVLRFAALASAPAPPALLAVFGQPDFSGNLAGAGATGLTAPWTVSVDGAGSLWVADSQNNRVLRWTDPTVAANGTAADAVVGQSSFSGIAAGAGPSGLNQPTAVCADLSAVAAAGTIWVSDTSNNRVLRFAVPPASNATAAGWPADAVLGQPDLYATGQTSPSPSSFFQPLGVAGNSRGDLIVGSWTYHASMYPAAGAINANSTGNASVAYGQTSLYSDDAPAAVGAGSLSKPVGVALGPYGDAFIASASENRVLLFPGGPRSAADAASGAAGPAAFCFGQPDLSSSGAGPLATQLNLPYGVFYDASSNALWVADSGNNRVLRYPDVLPQSDPVPELPVVVVFWGRTPAARMLPRFFDGHVEPGQTEFLVLPSAIEEYDRATNSVVRSVSLPSISYDLNVSTDGNGTQRFEFRALEPSAPVTLRYALFVGNLSLYDAGVRFSVHPGTLKLSVDVTTWNFSAPTSVLRLRLVLRALPAVTSIQAVPPGYSGAETFTLTAATSIGATLTATVRALASGVADDATVPVAVSCSRPPAGSDADAELVLDFPHFARAFRYDPDFSVTLKVPTGDDDGASRSDLLPLLSLVLLAAVPAFLFCGALCLVLAAWIIFRKRANARRSVNF